MIRKNVKFLCKQNHIKLRDLETELKIKSMGLSRVWFYKTIKVNQLTQIATKFSVPVDMLINYDLTKLSEKDIYEIIKKGMEYYEYQKNID